MARKDGTANLVPQNKRTKAEQKKIARMGGVASGKTRRERKTIKEALRAILDEPLSTNSDQTKLDGITIKVVKKMFDDPDVRDLKVLAEIMGEVKQTVTAEGLQLNITTSKQGKDNINELMKGE